MRIKQIGDDEAEALFLMGVPVYVKELVFWRAKDDSAWDCARCWDCRESEDRHAGDTTYFALTPHSVTAWCGGPHFPKMNGDYYLISDEEDHGD